MPNLDFKLKVMQQNGYLLLPQPHNYLQQLQDQDFQQLLD
jgi:hypothetical protein